MRFCRRFLGVWAVAMLPLAAVWGQTEPAATGTSTDEIDVVASRIYVHVRGVRLGHEHGIEGKIREGVVRLGAKENAGVVKLEMNSFEADTDAARELLGLEDKISQNTRESVTRTMLGERVLNAKQFPTATFTIDSATSLSKPSEQGLAQYELAGTLEWHGVKRPLKFTVEVEPTDNGRRLRGQFPLVQTEFGIKPYSAVFGAVAVADELTIHSDVYLKD